MSPLRVLIAGMPRSGSTWCFNAARALAARRFPAVHAAWINDYEAHDPAPCHVVKAHRPEQVDFDAWRTITSKRDIAACIASSIGMGWVNDEREKIVAAAKKQDELYAYWRARSDHEVDYEQIIGDPAAAIAGLAACLEVEADDALASELAARLADLKPPSEGPYDPRTLLHPGHRHDRSAIEAKAAEVRAILAGADS